jgi:hypothetical protein
MVLCEPAKFNDIEKEYKPDIMVFDGVAGIWEPAARRISPSSEAC